MKRKAISLLIVLLLTFSSHISVFATESTTNDNINDLSQEILMEEPEHPGSGEDILIQDISELEGEYSDSSEDILNQDISKLEDEHIKSEASFMMVPSLSNDSPYKYNVPMKLDTI